MFSVRPSPNSLQNIIGDISVIYKLVLFRVSVA